MQNVAPRSIRIFSHSGGGGGVQFDPLGTAATEAPRSKEHHRLGLSTYGIYEHSYSYHYLHQMLYNKQDI
jgi:hypothetical protein